MNMETYPSFMNDTTERSRRGQMPAADRGDPARALGLSDRIHRQARAVAGLRVSHRKLAR